MPVLVMELVRGETLADRLHRGPLPLKEALAISQQIAEALASAHEKGVLHRDLKPANISLTPEGRIKLLDFGLARAIEEDEIDLRSQLSTATSPASDGRGVMGTAPYMSPEQARGQELDRRTDIWSFGCVLYELVTAKRSFPGATFAETAAAVLEREPDWGALPETTPVALRRLLQQCLKKDRDERLRDAADAGLGLRGMASEFSSGNQSGATTNGVPASDDRPRITKLTTVLALVLVVGVLGFLAVSRARIQVQRGERGHGPAPGPPGQHRGLQPDRPAPAPEHRPARRDARVLGAPRYRARAAQGYSALRHPGGLMLLEGKRGLVLGIANKRSIAWGIAQAAHREGARLAVTYQGERLLENVQELSRQLRDPLILPCDVTKDEDLKTLAEAVKHDFGTIDFVVHAVAFALREELDGEFLNTSREGYRLAQDISSYSLTGLARETAPLMPNGGSIVTLSYLGGERVVPHYNVMGVAKAALEMSVRYLASDLGPKGIRVNAISAGPIKTLAASGVHGLSKMLEYHRTHAPLRRNTDQDEVGDTGLFLISPLSRGVTGEVIHVDGGFHVMGMAAL